DVPAAILSQDLSVALDPEIDIVVECVGGTEIGNLVGKVLANGRWVVSTNKAAIATHWDVLSPYARGLHARLAFSAAVGGAVPALEAISRHAGSIRSIRGVINGTCNFVLDELAQGRTLEDSVRAAQVAGYAEADPHQDLSGRDSADKLALLIASATHRWILPDLIAPRGIDAGADIKAGTRLIAWANLNDNSVSAGVEPIQPPTGSFLAGTSGAENRLEIELACGTVVRLRGLGAGRWPTTVAAMADLHAIARYHETESAEPLA
ncbi:MAG TPA: hypothetical protein VN872_08115, partial [Candidatus Acidoferrum sp.]|nr:hypothetical protein [Candidatus Acidoferrum sp.]